MGCAEKYEVLKTFFCEIEVFRQEKDHNYYTVYIRFLTAESGKRQTKDGR